MHTASPAIKISSRCKGIRASLISGGFQGLPKSQMEGLATGHMEAFHGPHLPLGGDLDTPVLQVCLEVNF